MDISYIIRKIKKTEIFESVLSQCAQKEKNILWKSAKIGRKQVETIDKIHKKD